MTNWTVIKSVVGESNIREFASGDLSGRGLYELARNTDAGGEVRTLLRNRGVSGARTLARKSVTR